MDMNSANDTLRPTQGNKRYSVHFVEIGTSGRVYRHRIVVIARSEAHARARGYAWTHLHDAGEVDEVCLGT